MPTPDKTSLDAIVLAGRGLLEKDGLAGLTMQAVAHLVGVRAPSLYKRIEGRDRLIQLVAEATLTELADRLAPATTAREVANGYRAFSHERPAAFQLCMVPAPHTPLPGDSYWAAASEAVLRVCGALTDDDHALDAARTLTAWAVGFLSIELNSGFHLGGDVEQAWEFGLTRVIEAITTGRAGPSRRL